MKKQGFLKGGKGTISDYGKVVTGKNLLPKTELYGGNMPFIKTPDMQQYIVMLLIRVIN